MFNEQKILLGAIGGLLGAVLIDLDAYSEDTTGGFNWRKAIARWVKGAVVGAAIGAGLPITGIV